MHFLIVADAFLPMRTSAAVMLADLGVELVGLSHSIFVVVPSSEQTESISLKNQNGLKIFSVKAFRSKDVGYIRRIFAESINPYFMWYQLHKYPPFREIRIDGIIWYSPTIFWGGLVKRLKSFFRCNSYLILRDIFPNWALDLGLLSQGPIYSLFEKVALYQYSQANRIGVQSPNNLKYFLKRYPELGEKTEVLWNWVRMQPNKISSIQINKTSLAGKKIGIYAGNIGVAQGVQHFINLSRILTEDPKIGIIFVGRGRDMERLKVLVTQEKLARVLFFDEIDSSEIASLYSQCDFGLLVLDPRHKTHNIPGKFISYLHSHIPTFGLVNENNDLLEIVNERMIGRLSFDYSEEGIRKSFSEFNNKILMGNSSIKEYIALEEGIFSSVHASKLIAGFFESEKLVFQKNQ